MELDALKRSVTDLARMVGAAVESKMGERAKLEDQVRATLETLVARATGRVKLRFKKLENFRGELPAYQSAGAAGLDVRARLEESLTLAPGARALIPTGLAVEIPAGFEVQVRPRSGMAIKKGLGLVNSPGTIDSDYRGELKIIVINLGQETIAIVDEERIAQLVVSPVIQAQIEEVSELGETGRGGGGFGSTGA